MVMLIGWNNQKKCGKFIQHTDGNWDRYSLLYGKYRRNLLLRVLPSSRLSGVYKRLLDDREGFPGWALLCKVDQMRKIAIVKNSYKLRRPNVIKKLLILGMTNGVLLIGYKGADSKLIHSSQWYPSPEAAIDAAVEFGVRPEDWIETSDERDELYGLSVMKMQGFDFDGDTRQWLESRAGNYAPD